MNVKRFDPCLKYIGTGDYVQDMEQNSDGEYVLYLDIVDFQRQIESFHGVRNKLAFELVSLENQLDERDAALARCVEALRPFTHADLCEEFSGNVQGDLSPVFGRNKALLILGDFRRAATVVASLPTSAQATAKALAAAKETQEKYNELLYAVSIKHPNETRHETALRYIRQAEYPQSTAACEAIREEQDGK